MKAIALAIVLLTAPPDPLPDGQSIDSLAYSFMDGDAMLGGGGTLSIFADGKVSYNYSSAPFTGSGGRVVKLDWTLAPEERDDLFRQLIQAGLLDLPDGVAVLHVGGFRVTSGRWHRNLSGVDVPDEVLAPLLPLLVKADRPSWGDKLPEVPATESTKLTCVEYKFVAEAHTDWTSLAIQRNGNVFYERHIHPLATDDRKKRIHKEWTISEEDAASLLDALVADGVCEQGEKIPATYGTSPVHRLHLEAGKWRTEVSIKALPDNLLHRFQPLLREADPEFWK